MSTVLRTMKVWKRVIGSRDSWPFIFIAFILTFLYKLGFYPGILTHMVIIPAYIILTVFYGISRKGSWKLNISSVFYLLSFALFQVSTQFIGNWAATNGVPARAGFTVEMWDIDQIGSLLIGIASFAFIVHLSRQAWFGTIEWISDHT